MNKFFLSAICIACLFSCKNNQDKTATTTTGRTVFFDKAGMDTTVKPGDNFFEYVNGAWVKVTAIPDDQSRWGSFNIIYEDNLAKMKSLLQNAENAKGVAGSAEQKIGDYYASGMDTATIEQAGITPLKPVLDKIAAIKDNAGVVEYMLQAYAKGEPNYYGMDVGADEKNSSRNIPVFYQNGTSLPTKNYYTKTDSASGAARNALVTYASKLFALTGSDTSMAQQKAKTILDLETQLANFQRTPVEMRDPQKNYNKMAVATVETQWPNLRIKDLFASINASPDSIDVGQPEFFSALNTFVKSIPVETWKTKLSFDYIKSNATLLTKPFNEAAFTFSKTFSGQKVDSDRWKKMVNRSNAGMGDLLGKLYVDKYFTPEAKKRMDELVSNLSTSFQNRINNLDWMSDSTKTKAKLKLNAFLKKIGYPDTWKKYDDVTISKNDFFANAQSIRRHNIKESTDKIGKPVDRAEWGMTAPTVNAYYNPTNNEIVFPAGILQFPFFDANADDAINYGGIGMVIGHEMTHGFDDQGSQYNDVGNMQNWWLTSDNDKFKAKTKGVVAQYNGFTVLDTVHINGELTLGENLADIGGLAIAYDAFKLTKQGKDSVKIDGFTPDQRFFLGFAQVWRQKARDASRLASINTDPHSPEMYRVNGPVQNFDPWYKAFNILPGDKMYLAPEKRAHIW